MRKYLTDDYPEDLKIKDFFRFYKGFSFNMYLEKAGYFDERPVIHTSVTQIIVLLSLFVLPFYSLYYLFLFPLILFGYGKLYIYLPIKTGIQDSDSASWGFSYHNQTVWIYIGGAGNFEGGRKWISWNVPFITKDWVRTSILLKDGIWEHETKTNRKSFYEDEWKSKQKSWTYNYTDQYDGEVIPTTIYVEEREWRPKWLKWTKLFEIVNKSIDVHFSKECGKEKGSWKGGALGCSYSLLPNESPLDCLKRMEKERKF